MNIRAIHRACKTSMALSLTRETDWKCWKRFLWFHLSTLTRKSARGSRPRHGGTFSARLTSCRTKPKKLNYPFDVIDLLFACLLDLVVWRLCVQIKDLSIKFQRVRWYGITENKISGRAVLARLSWALVLTSELELPECKVRMTEKAISQLSLCCTALCWPAIGYLLKQPSRHYSNESSRAATVFEQFSLPFDFF